MEYAILDGTTVVPCDKHTAEEWRDSLEAVHGDWRVHVGKDRVGPYLVSTVFLGYDPCGSDPVLWFETCILGCDWDVALFDRYHTWAEAETGHKRAVDEAEKHLKTGTV